MVGHQPGLSDPASVVSTDTLNDAPTVIIPLSLSVLTVLFSEEERPKAVAIVLAATMVGYPLGPVLGGWLLTHYWWGSVFLINVPVVALALLTVAALMPESRAATRPRLDLIGIVVSSLGLVGVTYGVIEAGQHSWGNPDAIAALSGGVVVLAAFVLWKRRIGQRQRHAWFPPAA